MSNIFIIATLISITFFFSKFFEMRFIEKESKPLKFLFRDTLIVYFSVLVGNFIMSQLNLMLYSVNPVQISTPVFTDNPGF
jgi:hypothetical protein